MPGRARSRYTTFLVAVTAGHEAAPTVYAVMATGAEAALEAVRTIRADAADIAIVGSLSTRLAKALRLKPGEIRIV